MGEAIQLAVNSDKRPILKTNITIWLVYSSEHFKEHFYNELMQCRNLNLELIPLNELTPQGIENRAATDLVFIETGQNWATRIAELHANDNSTLLANATLVVFGDESDNASLKTALRVGASDFLSAQTSFLELLPLLKLTAEEKVSQRDLGELILFINTKGGSGATTMALNSAIEIASYNPDKVLLLDIDIPFGVVADYLDVQPKYGLIDAIDNVADMDEMSLGGLVTKHESGLHMLSFSKKAMSESYDKAKRFGKLLPVLRQYYPYIIVDFSRGVDAAFSNVVSPATKIFLVTQQNIMALKHATESISALQYDYGIPKDYIEVIVNRFEKKQPIKLKDIEMSLPDLPTHLVPNDFKVAIESANLGKPFVIQKKKSAISKSIQDISHKLAPEPKQKQGWFQRLF